MPEVIEAEEAEEEVPVVVPPKPVAVPKKPEAVPKKPEPPQAKGISSGERCFLFYCIDEYFHMFSLLLCKICCLSLTLNLCCTYLCA